MSWYDTEGNASDVVISSRIRFARNLTKYPFRSRLSAEDAKKIIEEITAVLEGWHIIDFEKLSDREAMSYVEKHYVSPQFAKKGFPHALAIRPDGETAVMICEEDHIRLQTITPGLSLGEAYRSAREADELLDEKLDIAFQEDLGYLTNCPTNLGTGMRASAMLFLPALTEGNYMNGIASELQKLGLTIRGMYGEGSSSEGSLYQISNQVTLGINEDDSLKILTEAIHQIADKERKLRQSFYKRDPDALSDRVMRSYGILKYARKISTSEFMKLYSNLRLGISLGILDCLSYAKLGRLLNGIMPASLSLTYPKEELSSSERDKKRAEYIRKELEEMQ